MSGSLQTKKNMYYAVLSLKDESGKNKTKWVALKIPAVKGNKRKAEAELKRILAESEAQNGLIVTDKLFCDYLSEWLENHRRNITQGS